MRSGKDSSLSAGGTSPSCGGPVQVLESERRRIVYGCAFFVFLVSLLVFIRTVGMDFVYDDLVLLKERSVIWSSDIFKVAFGSAAMASLGKATPYYRPLFILSLGLDHRLWGVNAAGFHLVNVLLHASAATLLFFTARRLFRNSAAAVATALLFALHPVQAESVTWIAARGDIICVGFMTASFLAYLEYSENGRSLALGLSLLLFSGALLSKEMGITLPLMILLHALIVRKERGSGLWRYSLYAAPIVIYLGLRLAFLPEQTWGKTPLLWRLCTGVGLLARYIANAFFPFDLRVFYDIPIQKSAGNLSVILPAFLVLAAVIAVILVARRLPLVGFGLAWFLLALLPVSGLPGLIQPALMADRYLYVPIAGLGIAFGGIVKELMQRRREAAFAAGIVLLVASGSYACVRTGNWRDQSAFRDSVIRDAPQNYFSYYYSGQKLLEQGRLDEALAAFSRALQLNPILSEAYGSRG